MPSNYYVFLNKLNQSKKKYFLIFQMPNIFNVKLDVEIKSREKNDVNMKFNIQKDQNPKFLQFHQVYLKSKNSKVEGRRHYKYQTEPMLHRCQIENIHQGIDT